MRIHSNLSNDIIASLSRATNTEKAASTAAGKFSELESELIKQASKGENAQYKGLKGEEAVALLRSLYDRAKRIFELIDKILERKMDQAMRIISRIGGR